MTKKQESIWFRTLRKYRRIAERQSNGEFSLQQKLNILRRRLLRMNRVWRLGIATASLMAWLNAPALGQFPATIEASALNGTDGFIIDGVTFDDYLGKSVSSAGDINGDGINDLIIATYIAEKSYVVFGSTNGSFTTGSFDLTSLNGSNGFSITSDNNRETFVSNAGDLNADNIDDIVIGVDFADFPNGRSYIIFGSSSSFPSSIDTSSLNGTTGFSITGNSDRLGGAVSNAGDINGDNIDDLIIGATGKSYIIFGKSSSFSPNLNASTLNGMNGFTINGNAAGTSVSSAGDINDDGIGDIIIGTGNSGDAYVVFGNSTGFSSNLELSTLDGSDGFMVNGRGDRSYVSSAGDVNDDGLDDIIIGSPSVSTRANGEGECYLIFGQSNFNSILDVSSLNGSNGFTLFNNDGIIASIGNSVSGGYDINNDNIDDFIIGAPRATPSNGNTRAGKSYIVFGGQNKFTQSSFELSGLDGDNGFVISGFEDRGEFGYSVSGLEDVNGDGIDDLITSAHYSNNYYGQCFVVFGKQGCITVSPTLSVTVSSPQIEEDSGLNTLIYTFTASLSPTCEDLTVKFAVSGDATYNDDYYLVRGSENFNGSTGTTIIPVGQTSVDLVFQTQQDAIFESDESIIVMIENP